jgi:hypothetical protein
MKKRQDGASNSQKIELPTTIWYPSDQGRGLRNLKQQQRRRRRRRRRRLSVRRLS